MEMEIEIEPQALAYLRSRGGVLTVDLFLPRGCCLAAPQVVTRLAAPAAPAGYAEHAVGDVRLFLARALRSRRGRVRVRLARTLAGRDLVVEGIDPV